MSFVGRERELALLEAQYEAPASAFVPIYGRRRVGKSELILHFMKDRPGLYHVGKTAPASLQLREFLQQAARVLQEPLLEHLPDGDWRTALETVVQRKPPGKLIIALDEFQWLVQASPELPSLLQALWDTSWKRRKDVMLILCGSYVGFMERDVLGNKSPLFGRRTAQIKLPPFSYREAARFFPRWSRVDQAAAYFVCGGMAMYLRAFDANRSLAGNIEHNILDEFAALNREPEFLLREELREVESYYAVLLAIATGHTRQKDIAAASGLPERSIPYYLNQLVELGYVGRRFPLTRGKPKRQDVRFVVEDALLRFWFRFVFPNLSFLQQLGPARTFAERIKPELAAYFGLGFERLSREALPYLYQSERVAAGARIGEYWDKNVQLDLVSVRDDNWTDLGECKWGPVSSPGAVLESLLAKVGKYPNPENATIGLRIFSRDPVKSAARALEKERGNGLAVSWHTLADLYE